MHHSALKIHSICSIFNIWTVLDFCSDNTCTLSFENLWFVFFLFQNLLYHKVNKVNLQINQLSK